MCGRWSGMSATAPSSSSIAVLRGFVNGSRIALSWAPEGVGESACQVPHAIPALLQLHIAAVLLELVINRLRPIRVGGIDHSLGEAAQIRWSQDRGACSVSSCSAIDQHSPGPDQGG